METTEGQSKDQISDRVRKFADSSDISKGKEVCIYTGDYFYANDLNNTVKDLPLWVAHYGVDKPDAKNYEGFQYTSKGKVAGISGNVDLDEFSNGILIGDKKATNQTSVTKKGYDFLSLQKLIGAEPYDNIPGPLTLGACPQMKKGAKSDVVKWMQQRLVYLGYSVGKYGADGIFGKDTDSAVRKFQKARGLAIDGIVGPKTWSKLLGL